MKRLSIQLRGGCEPEGPEPVVVLLARRVPEMEEDVLVITLHLGGVVFEHRGHIVRRELLRRVRDEERCFADSTVPD